jgi:DNA-directed RNA polymerase II subunit RPB1
VGKTFDGDEMNIHAPQGAQSATELRLIANARLRFVKPTDSKIAIKAIQDALMGSWSLTRGDKYVDWKDFMNMMMTTSVGLSRNEYMPKYKSFEGKYVYSQIVPPGINIEKKKDDGSYALRIINGLITDGTFATSEIGAILSRTWFQYGGTETVNFIDDVQRMMLAWLMRFGYTTSISNMIVPKTVNDDIYNIIETKRKEAVGAITEYENDPYVMTSDAFETNMRETLKSTASSIEKTVMNNFTTDNGLFICISSGSSGQAMNAGQIVGCVGQVIVEEKRIRKRFNNRTLPTFCQHDDSPFARGFCANSFITGLNPMEFFFHVMSGREGIINTAIKTADKIRIELCFMF